MAESRFPEPVTLDERVLFTLAELCRCCDLAADDLVAMVEEGLLHPRGAAPRQWRFPASDLSRIQAARRLQLDLGLNLAGAALALDLLEEMERIRARMRVLEKIISS